MTEGTPEMMRINQFLACCGFGSRRSTEQLVKDGKIRVNGRVETDLHRKIGAGDIVKVGQKVARMPQNHLFLMFNKPRGCLCSRSDPMGRKLIYDFIPKKFHTLHHIGRLDYKSRGLLILTSDGYQSEALLHPSTAVPRTYQVITVPRLKNEDMDKISAGVKLDDGYQFLPAQVKKRKGYSEITLKEGKNREIRKIMEHLGYRVQDLYRVSFGNLKIGALPEGEARVLSSKEILLLNP